MQPVIDERALYHKGVLVAADLHIGFEEETRRAGIRLQSETPRKLERLKALVEKTKPNRILVLGDLKHEIPYGSAEAEAEVREFIRQARLLARVEIVKGNHDGNLEYLDVPVHPPSGVVLGDAGYFHGNAWPDAKLLSCKYIVMGHAHPLVMLRDKLGHQTKLPCWVRGKLDADKTLKKYGKDSRSEVIVMPAFSELAGGAPVNLEKPPIGPLLKLMDRDASDIYLLDGTCLGPVSGLKLNTHIKFRTRQ